MTCKQTWRPDVSYAATSLGSEEGGRGSLQAPSTTTAGEQELETTKRKNKTHIPRRKTPTVMVLTPTKAPRESQGYKTIETKKDPTLLQLSRKTYDSTPTTTNNNNNTTKNRNWFCGWTDYEHLDLSAVTGPGPSDGDRSRLQTPMEGLRGTVHGSSGSRVSSSRYSSSRGGRRKEEQRAFQHYSDVGVYMEEYRRLYCYTTLSSAPSLREDERVFCEGEEVEQDGEAIFSPGVKSLYRGDQHIRDLVSRFGVRDLSGGQETQQQHNPRPTPPSIVKRRRDRRETADIVVSNSTAKR